MKTEAEYFIDWESHVFGYGYGTGEQWVIPELRKFMELCYRNGGGSYDHEQITGELGGPTAWLLINALCHADIVEYGTSPRFGWLTPQGTEIRSFMLNHESEELVSMVCDADAEYIRCMPDYCNCDDIKDREGGCCFNPFWKSRR